MRAFSVWMHFTSILPLALFGFGSVFALCVAIRAAHDNIGAALMIAATGLIATLAYPAAIDIENWFEKNLMTNRAERLPRVPIGVYDALFLGGGLAASWVLAAKVDPLESIAIAIVVWIIAGTSARRRAAERDAPVSKQKS